VKAKIGMSEDVENDVRELEMKSWRRRTADEDGRVL
jgi:hypothetical protein